MCRVLDVCHRLSSACNHRPDSSSSSIFSDKSFDRSLASCEETYSRSHQVNTDFLQISYILYFCN